MCGRNSVQFFCVGRVAYTLVAHFDCKYHDWVYSLAGFRWNSKIFRRNFEQEAWLTRIVSALEFFQIFFYIKLKGNFVIIFCCSSCKFVYCAIFLLRRAIFYAHEQSVDACSLFYRLLRACTRTCMCTHILSPWADKYAARVLERERKDKMRSCVKNCTKVILHWRLVCSVFNSY